MKPGNVLRILQALRMLPYFPADEFVMNALVKLVGDMCQTEDRVQWLVNRMTSGIYDRWPGPHEMRAVYCFRYPPKDGVSAFSTVYPDGLPKDPTAPRRIEAPQHLELPPGAVVSADKTLDAAVVAAADVVKMPTVRGEAADRFSRILKEIVTPPQDRPMRPAPEPMTELRRAELQAQIDEVLRQRREGAV